MDAKTDKHPFRSKVRRRLIRAIADLHPEVEIVRVRAWTAAEAAREPDLRWQADERSQGRGTHDAYLVIVKKTR